MGGFLSQHKLIIFFSKIPMCHAHICHDPRVSRVETTSILAHVKMK